MRPVEPFHRAGARGRSAFTLIDLTLTLFIIGLFAAIAFPRYGQLVAKFRADAAAKQLAADLHFARQQAKLRGTSQEVQFDAVADQYELVGLSDLDRPDAPYLVDLSTAGPATDLLTASFGVSGTETGVTFDLYGRPDSGGSVIIVVGGKQRTILVDAASGEVEIQP